MSFYAGYLWILESPEKSMEKSIDFGWGMDGGWAPQKEPPKKNTTGWWARATPLKNMKVNWDAELPNIWEKKKWQPNHQPDQLARGERFGTLFFGTTAFLDLGKTIWLVGFTWIDSEERMRGMWQSSKHAHAIFGALFWARIISKLWMVDSNLPCEEWFITKLSGFDFDFSFFLGLL